MFSQLRLGKNAYVDISYSDAAYCSVFKQFISDLEKQHMLLKAFIPKHNFKLFETLPNDSYVNRFGVSVTTG